METRKMLAVAVMALLAGVGIELAQPVEGSAQSLQCNQFCNGTYCEYTPVPDLACEDIVQGTCDTHNCPI